MNLIQKTRNFIYLMRNGVSLKGSLYSFKGKLTDGDKYFIALLIIAVVAVGAVKFADRIDGVSVAEVRK